MTYCFSEKKKIDEQTCLSCINKTCQKYYDEYFFCLVVGSRTFNDYQLMSEKLDKILCNKQKIIIVSGGAKGADSLAEKYAKEHEYPCVVFKADWSKGKSAGFKRNEEMHQFIAHAKDRGCVAFHQNNSKGTAHNFGLAAKYGNQIRRIETPSDVP